MRYFFHVEDGDSFLDKEGQELSSAAAEVDPGPWGLRRLSWRRWRHPFVG